MQFFTALITALALGGQAGAEDWKWFLKTAEAAENRARDGNKTAAKQLLDQMQKTAATQKDDVKVLFVQWKKGVCECYLGDYKQSITTLEAIEVNEKNRIFRHALYRDLADAHLGGHTHTHDVDIRGSRYAIDTGFIVFNSTYYPLLTRLLAELRVATQPTGARRRHARKGGR